MMWIVDALVCGVVAAAVLPTMRRMMRRIAHVEEAVRTRMNVYLRSPIEQTLICVLLAFGTAIMVRFPEWPPWVFVVGHEQQSNTSPTIMLGSAAALLALLLFAANQAKTIEKDSVSGEEYLGRRLSTYIMVNSRTATVLWLPVFQIMAVLLFVLPLLRGVLPLSWSTPALGALSHREINPRLILMALWCTCFGVVAGSLLVNVTLSLRASMIGVFQRRWLKHMIEEDIEHTATQTLTDLFGADTRSRQKETQDWVERNINFAAKLPEDERIKYLSLTIRQWGLVDSWRDAFSHALRLLAKVRSTQTHSGSTTTQSMQVLRSMLTVCTNKRVFRRKQHVKDAVEALEDVSEGYLKAIGGVLESDSLPDDLRGFLVKVCTENAAGMDSECGELELLDDGSGRRKDSIGKIMERIVFSPENQLPTMENIRNSLRREEPLPEVELVPAMTYLNLADVLFPRYPEDKGSNCSGVDLRDILIAADRLRHDRTRRFVLEHLLTAIIDSTIVHRCASESLPVTTVSSHIGSRPSQVGMTMIAHDTEYPSLWDILENCAFSALLEDATVPPEMRKTLLDLTSGWKPLGGLLYALVYRHRERKELSAEDLRPFYGALRRFRYNLDGIRRAYGEDVARFLATSRVSHVISRNDVTWLFSSLVRPFNMMLLEEFDQMFASGGMGIGLLEFVQWRVIAGERINLSTLLFEAEPTPAVRRLIQESAPQILDFAAGWKDTDSYIASDLQDLVYFFPKQTDGSAALTEADCM